MTEKKPEPLLDEAAARWTTEIIDIRPGAQAELLEAALGILAHAWEEKQQGVRIKGPMPRDIPYRYNGKARRAVPDRRRSE